MSEIDFAKMTRILTRCGEIGNAPNAKTTVQTTYTGILEEPALAFIAADRAVTKAESAYAKEMSEASVALDKLDQPYREARSVVKAFVPTTKVPDTLKQLTTDTDRVNAIKTLVDVVDGHKTKTWAVELLTGTFGQKAQPTIDELNETIASSKVLDTARKTRASAFDPAYKPYLRFKRVVRDALGATSIEYKRIHLRNSPSAEADEAPPSAPG